MGFAIRSEVPEVVHPGLIIEYTIRPFARLRVTWVTEITHVIEGRLFVDEQRSGPYRMWHHEHHFAAVSGGVEMRDVVSYTLPLGPLGDLIDRLAVRGRLAAIFAYRETVLRDRFGAFPGEAHLREGV
jgi:ligand-binding SRPBCC domain-containing protein